MDGEGSRKVEEERKEEGKGCEVGGVSGVVASSLVDSSLRRAREESKAGRTEHAGQGGRTLDFGGGGGGWESWTGLGWEESRAEQSNTDERREGTKGGAASPSSSPFPAALSVPTILRCHWRNH